MERELIIADAHTKNSPKQRIVLPLNGGDPWYSYVWIDDECYVVYLNQRGKPVLEKSV